MMFRFLGWGEAADLIEAFAWSSTIQQKKVTYDFEASCWRAPPS